MKNTPLTRFLSPFSIIILLLWLVFARQSYVSTSGFGLNGQLGFGPNYANLPTPSPAQTINSVSGVVGKIVACHEFTLIQLESGKVYVLGGNGNYQLGTGNSETHLTPFLNPFLTGVIGVGCGSFHSFFWNSTGVYGAGQNIYGQLGIDSAASSYVIVPLQIPGLSSVISATGGEISSYVLNSAGSLFTFGSNGYGQLALSSFYKQNISSPTLTSLTSIKQVVAGRFHFLALNSTGAVFSCGNNEFGQLGVNTFPNTYSSSALEVIGFVGPIVSIAAGDDVSYLLNGNGQVYYFGIDNAVYYIPITFNNSQTSATPTPFQQMVTWNPSAYSAIEANDLGNIRFCMDINCTIPLYAWLESCSSATCSPSVTSATAWVNLNSSIPANGGTLTIYMVFQTTSTEFDGIYWGEYPGLSPTYGQYDNGALVFKAYFSGNTPISDFSVVDTASLTKVTGISGPDGVIINALHLTGECGGYPCFSFVTPMSNSGLMVESSFSLQNPGAGTDTGMAGLVGYPTYPYLESAISVNMGYYDTYFSQAYASGGFGEGGLNAVGTATSNWTYATLIYYGPNITNWFSFIAPQLYSTTGGYANNAPYNPLSSPLLYLGQFGITVTNYTVNVYYNFMRARTLPPNEVMPSFSFGSPTAYKPIKLFSSLSNVVQICSQGNYAMFLLSNSSVYSTGVNEVGQLGLGDFTNRNIPTLIPSLNGITSSIACGRDFAFANLSSNTMYSWGQNVFGEIGNSETTWVVPFPNLVNSLNGVTGISTLSSETYYLLSDGSVFANGQNSYGQLAQGDSNPIYTPTAISLPASTQVVQTPVGYHHALYLLNNGALYGAGDNEYGQLGIGNTLSPVTSAAQIMASGVSLVGTGHYHSFFVNSSVLYGMGLNSNYQLCLGNTYDQSSPTQLNISGISMQSVTGGASHSLFLNSSGDVYVCGDGSNGALGLGNTNNQPYAIANSYLSGITMIAAGAFYSVVANYSGVFSFGIAGSALGLGATYETNNTLYPIQISGLTNILGISAGYSHTLVLTETSKGQGIVFAFGQNSQYGELGLGDFVSSSIPVQLQLPLLNVIAVAAGTSHSAIVFDCIDGYAGSQCQYFTCGQVIQTDPTVCNSQGTCINPNQCLCNANYTGSFCQYPNCYGTYAGNSTVCNNHGLCIGVDKCLCNNLWSGPQCNITAIIGGSTIPSSSLALLLLSLVAILMELLY